MNEKHGEKDRKKGKRGKKRENFFVIKFQKKKSEKNFNLKFVPFDFHKICASSQMFTQLCLLDLL